MNKRILVIEDNPWNAQLVSDMLGSAGYEVTEMNNGYAGIEAAKTQDPHLILLDIMLPDINGAEVARILKQDPTLSHIPVVALTANASSEIHRQCMEAGCDSFMTKPFTKRVLLETVMTYIREEVD